jgi:hypothetical protein
MPPLRVRSGSIKSDKGISTGSFLQLPVCPPIRPHAADLSLPKTVTS